MSDYVLLTGGKNNAGDYLIKHRAMNLLRAIRPDRTFLDVNGWEPFSSETLDQVNGAEALILCGGPAIQKDMRERIYPMVENLDEIKAPICTLGVGWKSSKGNWGDTHNYRLSDGTKQLLQRINADGLLNSVRDYHTMNTLFENGVGNIMMTGCPALYDLEGEAGRETPGGDIDITSDSRVTFSTGVAFAQSASMDKSMLDIIRALKKSWPQVKVAFHHSLDTTAYEKAYAGKSAPLLVKQQELVAWLDNEGIEYEDISGSVETLVNYYNEVDLHIGFRVHAHIYMTSMGKPSVLLSEDGRAKALKDVLGGMIFDGYEGRNPAFKTKKKLFGEEKKPQDKFTAAKYLDRDLEENIRYERESGYRRFTMPMMMVHHHYSTMESFLKQLP